MLGSILDASIVTLALSMRQCWRELWKHLGAIAAHNMLASVASLFAYQTVRRAVGADAERSRAFAARSLTLALAALAIMGRRPGRAALACLAEDS
ncbi:hypothetical protein DL771_005438 [Monosporascus sp. 5C6A]|nr:hypothetical protein DL771_005438 [Monosporascus sp. 5C6A]